jgi:hypothetical protein
MPVHDWTRVNAGVFHAFHNSWISEVQQALNEGLLPSSYFALGEQRSGNFGPDVVTLQVDEQPPTESATGPADGQSGGLMTLSEAPPQVRFEMESDVDDWFYSTRQRSIKVRHVSDDRVVAIIEIISSGNKRDRRSLNEFIEKAATAFLEGVHLLIVDLYPPGSFDPGGLHGQLWSTLDGGIEEPYVPPPAEPLTLASYLADGTVHAFVEPLAVGAHLKSMPLFLTRDEYINVPLEETCMAAYRGVPRRFKQILERT